MWPFRRRKQRVIAVPAGHKVCAKDAMGRAQVRLRDALEHSADVDRLAEQVRRALGAQQ